MMILFIHLHELYLSLSILCPCLNFLVQFLSACYLVFTLIIHSFYTFVFLQ